MGIIGNFDMNSLFGGGISFQNMLAMNMNSSVLQNIAGVTGTGGQIGGAPQLTGEIKEAIIQLRQMQAEKKQDVDAVVKDERGALDEMKANFFTNNHYEVDEDGKIVVDENGRPKIVSGGETDEQRRIRVRWERDKRQELTKEFSEKKQELVNAGAGNEEIKELQSEYTLLVEKSQYPPTEEMGKAVESAQIEIEKVQKYYDNEIENSPAYTIVKEYQDSIDTWKAAIASQFNFTSLLGQFGAGTNVEQNYSYKQGKIVANEDIEDTEDIVQ